LAVLLADLVVLHFFGHDGLVNNLQLLSELFLAVEDLGDVVVQSGGGRLFLEIFDPLPEVGGDLLGVCQLFDGVGQAVLTQEVLQLVV